VPGLVDPAPPDAVTGRGRGRPRTGSTTDTRETIVAAARQHFADKGFDGTSVRAIAAEAGVDASLIRHYFGDKAGLLVATMQLPMNPLELIRPMLAQGPDGLGDRIVRTFLTAWDPHRDVISGLIRTTGASVDRGAPVLTMARNVILPAIMQVMDGLDVALRANLIMSQLVGMATVRYVLQLEPLTSAPVEQVVGWYGPRLQSLITPND
jgi:AcrR family transcriptional regulator